MEIWKDVPEYEGYYQVSNMGRIRSVERLVTQRHSATKGFYTRKFPERIMNPFADKSGYQYVSLSKDNCIERKCVHVLVLQAFIGNRPDNHECNHLNAIKNDNRLENLEYCTKSENIRYSYNFPRKLGGTKGENHHKAKLTRNDVKEIRQLYLSKQYTQVQLAKIFNVTQTNISIITRGDGWK